MKSQSLKDFYKLFFDNTNDGILLADLETKKFYIANKAICVMLGYNMEEIKSLKVTDIHPKEDLPYVVEQFERQSKGRIGETIPAEEMPVKRKDGSVFYADIGASRVKLAGREYLAGIFRDATQRRQIKKDLEDAKVAAQNVLEDLNIERLETETVKAKDEAMLASIGDGVVAVDQDGKIILMNRVAEQMLGQSVEQVMGKSLVEAWKVLDEKGNLVPERERPITIALRGKTTTTTTTTMGSSYFYTRKNGTPFPVAIIVTPVVSRNKIIGAIDVFRDITKEKEIEKLRMDFLSLASHQLRTPLSGTKWLIETMQKGITGKIEPKEKEYLDDLYQMNERMIKLVFDMLNVLRLESGSEAIKKEVIYIADLYQDLTTSMAAPTKSKWVVLKNALSLSKWKKIEVETDGQLLKTILECFVSNAINYTPSGKEVFLDAKEEKNTIIFSVKDNGIGIPEEEQSKIFERFYRASNAKKLKPEGTGLGLYIAKMLAEKIGGNIYFESKNGKGSTFFLSIPKKVI